MSAVSEYIPSLLHCTPEAVAKLQALVAEEANPELKLRVFVTGGGCSGFQYGFEFVEELNEDDTLIEYQGVYLVLDPLSYPYLVGSTLDYEEGLSGARFKLQNPNASTTCGCGASFSV
ncbi:iron-sulfur cluster insertion protein [Allopseudospirillum japonicum]|uniref:Iron-sulfur cluster insertion protein ErpA n=1 Tax=Allopseudospirillum japonicum TaxID=64971 RepID=A0A1H6TZS9_9GAMM|nr:iron-sulfur cluster insertion protein ErpA [Allopseudospirillum japonicum]SEI81252.1 iron-sulfur cluster insertion protein [Allopseudospirillum japonicum]